MKTSIRIIVVVMLMLGTGTTLWAQDKNLHNYKHNCSSYQTSNSIELEDSSQNESVKISVTEEIMCLNIGVSSNISSGALTMEIYDPEGDKQGNFSVESELNSNSSSSGKSSETVCGQINKTFKEPMKGDWVVKIKPKRVTGKVQIHSNQASSI